MEPSKFNELTPKCVLGVAAHPDDLDFGAAGSMAKWAATGADVYYLILTDGSKGTPDRNLTSEKLIAMRQAEQRAAAQILGVTDVFFLQYEDGMLECAPEVKQDIARVIRQIKPEVVVTMDPTVVYVSELGIINHPDHRAAGQATLDAVFPLARDFLSFPQLFADGLEPHKVSTVLLVNFKESNYAIDIADRLEQKVQALAAHISQMPDSDTLEAMLRRMAAAQGKKAGLRYAEGFVRIDVRG